ncbi:MAG: hypothetical protein M3R65_08030 [Gemmatimonadota bacterium]|nr:hypothetical protein [Gemmatimonadota bacterium]
MRATFLALAMLLAASACAHRIHPFTGVTAVDGVLPSFPLPAAPEQIKFRWELNQGSTVARGDGVARLGPPDRARVDLFLGGGFGGAAAAILIGDSLIVPPGARGLDLVPPAPLLWAALGRLSLPAVSDTVILVSGDTLRASLGRPAQWRVTAIAGQLTRVERVADNRIVESVERRPGKYVRYELSGQRSLVLDIQTQQPVAAFDESIWRF